MFLHNPRGRGLTATLSESPHAAPPSRPRERPRREGALKLDRASLAEVTEAERKAIEQLADNDPGLKADLAALVEKLHAQFAKIPPVEVKVQPLDQDNKPAGNSYTVTSEHGVIDLGDSVLTVPEFLLLAQAEQYRAARGFVIDDEWAHDQLLNGTPWPSRTVSYYFASSLSSSDRTWMRKAMQRMADGTGMKFYESTSQNWWLNFWHGLCLSRFVRISKEQLGLWTTGQATVGKLGCSKLVMDTEHVRDQDDFDHEMGHVFGLLHEHQRYDRDAYVRVTATGIGYDRIPERKRHWFLWWSWYADHSTTYSTPYDYQSVMHYDVSVTLLTPNKDGNRRWDVFEHNNSKWGDENGNTWFTPWDIYTIKKRYGITPNPKPTYTPEPYP